jgi:hypothetical protein
MKRKISVILITVAAITILWGSNKPKQLSHSFVCESKLQKPYNIFNKSHPTVR